MASRSPDLGIRKKKVRTPIFWRNPIWRFPRFQRLRIGAWRSPIFWRIPILANYYVPRIFESLGSCF